MSATGAGSSGEVLSAWVGSEASRARGSRHLASGWGLPASRTNPSSAAVFCACWRGMRCGGPGSRDSFAERCAGGPCFKRVLAATPKEKKKQEQQAAPTARRDSLRTELIIPSPERVRKKQEIAF